MYIYKTKVYPFYENKTKIKYTSRCNTKIIL